MSASEMMLVMNHARLVVKELKQGPKTVPELADACDLTESRVREALDVITDDGMIYPVDGSPSDDVERYALNESKVGGVAFVRSNGKRILRRLMRPFRR
jgi:predicted transcriptional regulator